MASNQVETRLLHKTTARMPNEAQLHVQSFTDHHRRTRLYRKPQGPEQPTFSSSSIPSPPKQNPRFPSSTRGNGRGFSHPAGGSFSRNRNTPITQTPQSYHTQTPQSYPTQHQEVVLCNEEQQEEEGYGRELSGDEFSSELKSSTDPTTADGGVKDVVTLLEQLSLAAEELDLSEEQLRINKQLQEDELLAMEAIYGDCLTILPSEGGQSFQIHVCIEGPDEFTISAKLRSFDKNVKFGEKPTSSIAAVDDLNSLLYSFKVTHLPPIVLTCLFPKSYPSHQPPYFTISSQWLDSLRISNLCRMLDSLWTKQPGQEIIYQWADWLHSSSLPFLGFEGEIILDFYILSNAGDCRAVSGSVSPDVDILSMMNYNEDRCHEVFLENVHQCCICFSELAGTEFIILPCKHLFCRKCMETYSGIHVKEGTVKKLLCPDAKCGGMIPPGLLKSLLGNEQFERWESLLLQKTLDSMNDIFMCPRCETTSIEDGDHHAQCPMCLFSFCSICKQGRHVGTLCVDPEMELETLERRQRQRQRSSQTTDPQKRKELERINAILSLKEIERDAEKCPSCKIWISRIDGCNHMACRNCGTHFCYNCNERISGYDHFRSGGCTVFPPRQVKVKRIKNRIRR